jgi:hypothetical protein
MNEIICPHCKKTLKVDEAGFADILKQVRNHEFDKELHERLELLEKDKESAVKLAEANAKSALQTDMAKKDNEIVKLRAEKDAEANKLKVRIESTETEEKRGQSPLIKNYDTLFACLDNQGTQSVDMCTTY